MDIYLGVFFAVFFIIAIYWIISAISYLMSSNIHSKPFPWIDPTKPNPSKPLVSVMLLLSVIGIIIVSVFLWTYAIPLMEIHREQ
jgi:hypothetical protein